MAFQNHGNRSFTQISVHKNAPAASGVYGLSDAREWLYIGECADIRAELLNHLKNPTEFLRAHTPLGFTYELSSASDRLNRQKQLVSQLNPAANRLTVVTDAV